MSKEDTVIDETFKKSLLWGLKRLALYGELAQVDTSDPHVRHEAKSNAKVTLKELATQCRLSNVEEDEGEVIDDVSH